MLETLLWISIGAFIGWNFPQPSYAKTLQEKYLQDIFKNFPQFQ
jgi:hypothetical protein